MRFQKTFSDWLTYRYQFVIRDEGNLAERYTVRFSYAQCIFVGTILLGVLLTCSLSLSTTILAKWLHPAYMEQENKAKLLQLAAAVDILEEQTNQQKQFIALLQSIMAGKEPPSKNLSAAFPKKSEVMPAQHSSPQLSSTGKLSSSEFEDTDSSPATSYAYSNPTKDLHQLCFFPRSSGMAIPFKPSIGSGGEHIVAREYEPIQCLADGVVVFSAWTAATGWMIVIQHKKDLLAIYKHNVTVLKKVGNFVAKGDVIAIMGNPGELSVGLHRRFELWHEGKAVDPVRFTTF